MFRFICTVKCFKVQKELFVFVASFRDSVRVDGIGPASISEVSYRELVVTKDEDDDTGSKVPIM